MTPRTQGRLLLGIAIVCAVLLYARTLHFDFVYDDWPQIVRNPHLQSVSYIPQYFTEDVWSQNQSLSLDQSTYYRPVFLLWLLLNRSLFGISPAGWHATSLGLETVAICLLFIVGTNLSGDPVTGGIATLIFAIHPANIESVAWVSSSSELLMGVFLLLSFLSFLRFRASGQTTNLLLSVFTFALALGCKETAVSFPLILIWHEWCYRRCDSEFEPVQTTGTKHPAMVERLGPYFVAILIYFLFRIAALGYAFGSVKTVSRTVALLTMPSALFFYLHHLVVPSGLSCFYDLSYIETASSAKLRIGLLLSILAVGLIWLLARRVQAGRAALGWVFLPLLPPLAGLAQFQRGDLVHDRYLYLSTMGFAVLVAALFTEVKRRNWEGPAKGVLFITIVSCFVWFSVTQIGAWRNKLALYRRAVQIAPRSVLALDNLANELYRQKDFVGAISAYQRSLAVDPTSWKTNFAFAVTLVDIDSSNDLVAEFDRATHIEPWNAGQYILLARILEQQNLLWDAEKTIDLGLVVAGNSAELHFELGSLMEKRGDLGDARAEYQRTLVLDPQRQDAASRITSFVRPTSRPSRE